MQFFCNRLKYLTCENAVIDAFLPVFVLLLVARKKFKKFKMEGMC